MTVIVEYSSNNSGGSWWLSDDDWEKLAEAGWNVHWEERDKLAKMSARIGNPDAQYPGPLEPRERSGERFRGALASHAAKEFEDPADAVQEFEQITGQDAGAIGCNCCGAPHSFSYIDADGGYHYTSTSIDEPASGAVAWS